MSKSCTVLSFFLCTWGSLRKSYCIVQSTICGSNLYISARCHIKASSQVIPGSIVTFYMDLYTPKLYIVPSSDDRASKPDLQNHHIEEYMLDLTPYAATSSRNVPLAGGTQTENQHAQPAMSSYSAQAFPFPFMAYERTTGGHFGRNEPWFGNYGDYLELEIPGNTNHGRVPAQRPSLYPAAPPLPYHPMPMNNGYQVEGWSSSAGVPTQVLSRHQISTNSHPPTAVVSGDQGPSHRRALRTGNPQVTARTGRPTPQGTRDAAGEGSGAKSPGSKRQVVGPVLRGKTTARFRPCPFAFRDLPAYLKQKDPRYQLYNCFEGCHKLRFGENGFSRRSNLLAHLKTCHRQEVPNERE